MTIRLYLDEDSMDRALVRGLRARGADVLTAFEAGMIEKEDEQHLEWATAENRALFSFFNLVDFCRIHASFTLGGKGHAGIIVAQQQRYTVGEQLRRLLKIAAAKSAEEMRNQLEFLSCLGRSGAT